MPSLQADPPSSSPQSRTGSWASYPPPRTLHLGELCQDRDPMLSSLPLLGVWGLESQWGMESRNCP